MILINKTFNEANPESSENGEFSDSGLVFENDQLTFRELITELRDHVNPSHSRGEITENTWFSSYFEVSDYPTMTERQTSIHFSSENLPRNFKYFKKAVNYLGLMK